jgi:membrane protein DedA with SNARE-associated domain
MIDNRCASFRRWVESIQVFSLVVFAVMAQTLQFVIHYGYWLLFATVLAEQLGLPIPAVPALLAMGALSGLGDFSFGVSLLVAFLACVSADFVWYYLGRTRGQSILNLLCRLSLEPDYCVSRTKGLFGRYGDKGLLVAKFLPGFSTVAPPMAGLTRMSAHRFLILDGAGALMWTATFLGIGYLFRKQLEQAAEVLLRFGSSFGTMIAFVLALYAVWQLIERRKFLLSLRAARVTPEEVMARLKAGEPLVILDLRLRDDIQSDPLGLPNAIHFTLEELEARHGEIPRDREIVLYCS